MYKLHIIFNLFIILEFWFSRWKVVDNDDNYGWSSEFWCLWTSGASNVWKEHTASIFRKVDKACVKCCSVRLTTHVARSPHCPTTIPSDSWGSLQPTNINALHSPPRPFRVRVEAMHSFQEVVFIIKKKHSFPASSGLLLSYIWSNRRPIFILKVKIIPIHNTFVHLKCNCMIYCTLI
jgi:hypothetical protein